jgi:transposase InsO family protein
MLQEMSTHDEENADLEEVELETGAQASAILPFFKVLEEHEASDPSNNSALQDESEHINVMTRAQTRQALSATRHNSEIEGQPTETIVKDEFQEQNEEEGQVLPPPPKDDTVIIPSTQGPEQQSQRAIILPTDPWETIEVDDTLLPDHGTLKRAQEEDDFCKMCINFITRGQVPKNKKHRRLLKLLHPSLIIEDDILFYLTELKQNTPKGDSRLTYRTVVPATLLRELIKKCHTSLAHPGITKTFATLKQDYYAIHMYQTIRDVLRHCTVCQVAKRPEGQKPTPRDHITATYVNERLCHDILQLSEDRHGHRYLLVRIETLSRLAECTPRKDKTARTVADSLYTSWISRYGPPRYLHADNSLENRSSIVKYLAATYGITQTFSLPYRPSGNGIVETFNRVILGKLRLLTGLNQQDWKLFLATAMHTYLQTPHPATGIAPMAIFLGRQPRLYKQAIKLAQQAEAKETIPMYYWRLNREAKRMEQQAIQNLHLHHQIMDEKRNAKARPTPYKVGDHVLIQRKSVPLGHKIKMATKYLAQVYYIARFVGKHTVEVANAQTHQLMDTYVHVHRLKAYTAANPDYSELQPARVDGLQRPQRLTGPNDIKLLQRNVTEEDKILKSYYDKDKETTFYLVSFKIQNKATSHHGYYLAWVDAARIPYLRQQGFHLTKRDQKESSIILDPLREPLLEED